MSLADTVMGRGGAHDIAGAVVDGELPINRTGEVNVDVGHSVSLGHEGALEDHCRGAGNGSCRDITGQESGSSNSARKETGGLKETHIKEKGEEKT